MSQSRSVIFLSTRSVTSSTVLLVSRSDAILRYGWSLDFYVIEMRYGKGWIEGKKELEEASSVAGRKHTGRVGT